MEEWRKNIGADDEYFLNSCPFDTYDNPNLGSENRSIRVRWYPSDNKDNYIESGNAYTIDSVDYDLNKHGFRCDEFDDIRGSKNKKLIVFGCSNTFGIGLPEHHVWPYEVKILLEKKYNEKIDLINLAMPGAGSDDIVRIISMLGDSFHPNFVCCFTPPVFRKTYTDHNGKIFNYLLSNQYNKNYHDSDWKRVNSIGEAMVDISPQSFYYGQYVAESLVRTYAKLNNASYKIITTAHYLDDMIATYDKDKNEGPWKSKARDSMHYGRHFHKMLAIKFIEGLFNE